ncbi:MAG: rsmD [Bacillales bacterium]|jgi:16S rRNA (guanine(966)-N(2))-methyltransferase RsmD|nr:rsmD [Bacillales bacterium]
MRVVSGKNKGMPLKAVPGSNTRPTTDKVKESIFNMIGPYFDGGIGLDLFAGSGGLGIEALSRGVDKVIFVDKDFKAIMTIRENLEACRLNESSNSEVYRNDYIRALKALKKRDIKFDYIFLDPPYKNEIIESILSFISENDLISDNGIVLAEFDSERDIPSEIGVFSEIKSEKYGSCGIKIYKVKLNYN